MDRCVRGGLVPRADGVGLGAKLLKRQDPGTWYWRLLAAVQVVIGLQLVAGIVLLAIYGWHARPLLHYFYGAVFPILILVVAHVVARGMERDRWVPFAWAGFFCFGLTLRALQTGCGDITMSALKHCLG